MKIKLLKCKIRYKISEFEFNVCILSASNPLNICNHSKNIIHVYYRNSELIVHAREP